MATPPAAASLGNGHLPPPGVAASALKPPTPPASPTAAPTTAPTPNAPTAAPAPPNPAQAAAAHDTMLGRAFKILSGHAVNYSVDPTTGQTVTTKTQNSPGQFFRNIVAGAIIGGAAGAQGGEKTEGSPLAAAARGGAAEMGQNRIQDQERIQRAQQEYQNELKADQEQRAQKEFQNEQTLFKAQMANTNLQQLKLHTELNGLNWTTHQKEAEAGQQWAKVYTDAGIEPTQTMLESQVQDFIQKHPGASTDYSFLTTGTQVTGHDPKTGLPTYESVVSLFPKDQNPNLKNYTIPSGLVKQLKDDGFDKYYPQLFDNLKPGTKISGTQLAAIRKFDTGLRTDNLANEKVQTEIDANKARVEASKAEIARANAETRNAILGRKPAEQFQQALNDLNAVNGDVSKLKPSDRIVIGESVGKLLYSLNDEIKSDLAANNGQQTAKTQQLMSEMDNLRNITTGAFNTPGNVEAPPAQPNYYDPSTGISYSIPQNKIDEFTKQNPSAVPYVPKTQPPATQVNPQLLQNLLKLPAAQANRSIDGMPDMTEEQKQSLKNRVQKARTAGIKNF